MSPSPVVLHILLALSSTVLVSTAVWSLVVPLLLPQDTSGRVGDADTRTEVENQAENEREAERVRVGLVKRRLARLNLGELVHTDNHRVRCTLLRILLLRAAQPGHFANILAQCRSYDAGERRKAITALSLLTKRRENWTRLVNDGALSIFIEAIAGDDSHLHMIATMALLEFASASPQIRAMLVRDLDLLPLLCVRIRHTRNRDLVFWSLMIFLQLCEDADMFPLLADDNEFVEAMAYATKCTQTSTPSQRVCLHIIVMLCGHENRDNDEHDTRHTAANDDGIDDHDDGNNDDDDEIAQPLVRTPTAGSGVSRGGTPLSQRRLSRTISRLSRRTSLNNNCHSQTNNNPYDHRPFDVVRLLYARDVLPGVVSQLRSEDAECSYWALAVIHEFVLRGIAREDLRCVPGFVLSLSRVVSNGDANVQKIAMRVIGFLALRNDAFKHELLASQTLLPKLVVCVASGDHDVAHWAMVLIHDIAMLGEPAAACLVAVPDLVSMLVALGCGRLPVSRRHDESTNDPLNETVSHEVELLLRLCAETFGFLGGVEATHRDLVAAGVLTASVAFLYRNDPELHFWGTALLLNLGGSSHEAKAMLSGTPELIVILTELLVSSSREHVSSMAAKVLVMLAFDSAQVRAVVERDIVKPLCSYVASVPGHAAVNRVDEMCLLSVLSRVPSFKRCIVDFVGMVPCLCGMITRLTEHLEHDETGYDHAHGELALVILSELSLDTHVLRHELLASSVPLRLVSFLRRVLQLANAQRRAHSNLQLEYSSATTTTSCPVGRTSVLSCSSTGSDTPMALSSSSRLSVDPNVSLSLGRAVLESSPRTTPVIARTLRGVCVSIEGASMLHVNGHADPCAANDEVRRGLFDNDEDEEDEMMRRVALCGEEEEEDDDDGGGRFFHVDGLLRAETVPTVDESTTTTTTALTKGNAVDPVLMALMIVGRCCCECGAGEYEENDEASDDVGPSGERRLRRLKDTGLVALLHGWLLSRELRLSAGVQLESWGALDLDSCGILLCASTSLERLTYCVGGGERVATTICEWSRSDTTGRLFYSGDRRTVRNDAWTFESVRANASVAGAGQYYYECEMHTTGIVQVGWASAECEFDGLGGRGVGDDEHSYAFDGCRCRVWHGLEGLAGGRRYGHVWSAGDVIGSLLDMDAAEISYFFNGELMGVAFVDVDVNRAWFPAVSLATAQQCSATFVAPFVYGPWGMRDHVGVGARLGGRQEAKVETLETVELAQLGEQSMVYAETDMGGGKGQGVWLGVGLLEQGEKEKKKSMMQVMSDGSVVWDERVVAQVCFPAGVVGCGVALLQSRVFVTCDGHLVWSDTVDETSVSQWVLFHSQSRPCINFGSRPFVYEGANRARIVTSELLLSQVEELL